MRIVSGKYKGKKIDPPGGLGIRPTTDRAREALFNIINNYYNFEDLSILDLFSGSGAVSIEFLSRGCKNICSVEWNRKTIIYLEKLSENLGVDNWYIYRQNCLEFLQNTSLCFDIIFMDPPYDMPQKINLVEIILRRKLFLSDGLIIMEHQSNENFSHYPFFEEKRTYGNSTFTFFKLQPDEKAE